MKKALKNTLKIFIFFIAWAICVSIGEINSDNPAIWRFWAEVIPLLWTLLLTIIFLCIERGRIKIPFFIILQRGASQGL